MNFLHIVIAVLIAGFALGYISRDRVALYRRRRRFERSMPTLRRRDGSPSIRL